MLDKKYWENVLKQVELQKENAEGAIEQDKAIIELCKKKISEFPDEKKDEMPAELKELAAEIKNA